MTPKQERILSTLIYFLDRYKKAIIKNETGTGFEDMVFEQMIETVQELKEENKRLSELNKPAVLKGGKSDDIEGNKS